MKSIYETKQLRNSIKNGKKQVELIKKLKFIAGRIPDGKPLDPRHRDHALIAPMTETRDCNVKPDSP